MFTAIRISFEPSPNPKALHQSCLASLHAKLSTVLGGPGCVIVSAGKTQVQLMEATKVSHVGVAGLPPRDMQHNRAKKGP